METTIVPSAKSSAERENLKHETSVYRKAIAFEDNQAKIRTFWYRISMIVQVVFFLPLAAVLVFYFNAPTLILIPTLTMFFANIIAGIRGAGIRTILSLYLSSVFMHIIMFTVFMI